MQFPYGKSQLIYANLVWFLERLSCRHVCRIQWRAVPKVSLAISAWATSGVAMVLVTNLHQRPPEVPTEV